VDSRQIKAMMELLLEVISHSVEMGMKTPTTTPFTIAEVEERYREACDIADTLRRYSIKGHADRRFPTADRELLRAAEMSFRKRGAEGYEREMKFATTNKTKTNHGRERTVAIRLWDTTQRLFGRKLGLGTVAKLATVAVGREITKPTVQNWVTPRMQK